MGTQERTRNRELRRARAAAVRRRQRRLRLIGGIGAVVIVGLLVAIGAVVVNALSTDETPSANSSGQLVTPANLTNAGAIPVGQADAPVTVEIYQDYMCPACGKFEQANTAELDRMIKAGTARVALRPIAFLDRTSQGTKYSTRAANAMATVADRAPASVWAFNSALYENQPEEGTRGLTDDQIATLATKAGVPRDVVDTFAKLIFERWVVRSTDTAFGSGIEGTPTVMINGTKFTGDIYTAGPLSRAIQAAASGTKQ